MSDAGLSEVARELRAPRAAGVAGLVFAALFVASLVLLRHHPAAGSNAQQIADWYLHRNSRSISLVGLYLVPFAGIAFLWFVAVIRAHVGVREDRFLATVFLGSGVLFVAMLYAAAAAAGSSFAATRFMGSPAPSPDVVVFARGLAYAFLYVYGVRAGAVFMMVVSTIGRRTGALPAWLVAAGYVLAVGLLVSVSFYRLTVLAFPVWVATVSVVILIRGSVGDEPAASGAA